MEGSLGRDTKLSNPHLLHRSSDSSSKTDRTVFSRLSRFFDALWDFDLIRSSSTSKVLWVMLYEVEKTVHPDIDARESPGLAIYILFSIVYLIIGSIKVYVELSSVAPSEIKSTVSREQDQV